MAVVKKERGYGGGGGVCGGGVKVERDVRLS